MTIPQQPLHKTLSVVLANIVTLPIQYDVVIRGLTMDSRQIKNGDLFVAIDGEEVNGIDYIDAAIEAGAVAVVWDAQADVIPFAWSKYTTKNNKKIPLIAINNLKEKLAVLANVFYEQPSEQLDIVAVTGTNGKTSCVNFIAQALGTENKCGLIGTLGLGIYPDISAGTHTTPDVLTVHKTLADFVSQNAGYAALEVSSHALAQGRTDGVQIDTAIFTNLTQDHLDYHGTMESYLNEKLKLFKYASLKTAIINMDDPHGIDFVNATTNVNIVTYSSMGNKDNVDVYASNIQYHSDCSEFILNTRQGSINIHSNLVGDFNISNLLAVCAYLQVKDFSLDDIATKVNQIQPVVGRMQKIKAEGFPLVIVDYAHTPDALEHVLQTLTKQYQGNLTCVFGCGGERDKDKRKKMGEIADQYTDNIVLTNDNPRSESTEKIIEQIMLGINTSKNVRVELDRKKAIIEAIKETNKNGCVVIAGKGHETYQIIGDKKINFSDIKVVEEFFS